MEEIIRLRSGGDEDNYLKKLPKPDGSESKTYVLKVSTRTLRVGKIDGGKKFIYPSGGPIIVVGYKLEEADAVVRSIDFVEGYGWTITFE